MESGIKQGCPLSSLLFTVYMDPVLRAVDADVDVVGWTPFPGAAPVKVVAYADDVSFFLTDGASFGRLSRLFCRVRTVLGLEINQAKSRVLALGPRAASPAWPVGVAWDLTSLVFLGVPLVRPPRRPVVLPGLLAGMKRRSFLLRSCGGSLRSRALLLNALVWSLATYGVAFLAWPRGALRAAARLLAVALWGRRVEPIRRSTVHLPLRCGGLGLVCPRVARAVQRVRFFRAVCVDRVWGPVYAGWLAPHLPFLLPVVGSSALRPLTPFLREVCEDLRWVHGLLGLADAVALPTSVLSARLVVACFPPPVVRMGSSSLALVDPLLSRVQCTPVFPAVKSLFWKLHNMCLPTGDWLLRRGVVAAPQSLCLLCVGPVESVEHLFVVCPFFGVLRRVVARRLGLVDLRLEHVQWLRACRSPLRRVLLLLFVWVVWTTRCAVFWSFPRPRRAVSVYCRLLRSYDSAGRVLRGDLLVPFPFEPG